MEINVDVSNIDLTTVVGKKVTVSRGYEGDYEEESGEDDLTLGDYVVKAIMDKAMSHSYPGVEVLVSEIRREQVAQATAAQVKIAIEKPYIKTNRYGEAQGEQTTLAELMFEHVTKVLTTYGKDGYNGRGDEKKDPLWNLIVTVVTRHMQQEWEKKIADTVEKAVKVVVLAGEKKIQAKLDELDTMIEALRPSSSKSKE